MYRTSLALLLVACTGDAIPLGGGSSDDADTADGIEDVGNLSGWVRDEVATPGSISFNELAYADGVDWIELHNPMALDVDLSGWSLAGGVVFEFPGGTVIPAGEEVVVDLGDALDDDGERIDLYNNAGRRVDSVAYDDDDPWPVGPDGSGFTLAKADPDSASDHAENWTASAEPGGTPGLPNGLDPQVVPTAVVLVSLDATWRYDTSGDYPAADWAGADYDDGAWPEGTAPFYAGGTEGSVAATLRVTADNYYAVYLGAADGSGMQLVAEDPDGDWTTVESVELDVLPTDHLYLAAWESPADYGGPQMTIAEVEVGDDIVGTGTSTFEWVLGDDGACPGTAPANPPPADDEIADLAAAGGWSAPPVDADRNSDPWGWANGAYFDAATRYVWVDTFSDASVTNTSNTYALFRSVEPLAGAGGTTQLESVPTTATFRTPFAIEGQATALRVECVLDDGAIVYLNGVEVYRYNMPGGAVDATTLASGEVTGSEPVYAELDTTALVPGDNVLAVELHQADDPDRDLRFACALTARVASGSSVPAVVLNELDAGFVELVATRDTSTDGLSLATSSGASIAGPQASLSEGELLVIEGLGLEPGDALFLYGADGAKLLDAQRVTSRPRARLDGGGAWRYPTDTTPGAANAIDTSDDIVINEIMYHHAPVSRDDEPFAEVPDEWIELYNRGSGTVDLGGWQLVDAVGYTFPAGTSLAPGGYLVVSDFTGRLDNSSDRILLLDAHGNPADEVHYHDGGRWPDAADGGGSSLELRDPRADNAAPEAWAASDEGGRAEWVSYRYRAAAGSSAVGPDGTWHELVVGLLGAGEVLLDDLSAVRDPGGDAEEQLYNGTFDSTDRWRLLGNHRHSEVVADPDDPANSVLRLVATGPTGHMHNHAETTLRDPIGGDEYEISFRARWVSGSNQLNTRLYFNRLAATTLLATPDQSGTPGAANSARDDIGPTFDALAQDIAVPAAHEDVAISVAADDPDGVSGVTLWASVDGAGFAGTPMALTGGRWVATLEGQPDGAIVQLYAEATDGTGRGSTIPAGGAESRALLTFGGGAQTNGLHNFRILLTAADSDWLHADENLMSDDLVGATVVYDEARVFYDVGLRTKGSQRGRPEDLRLGYGVRFRADEPFRGRHSSVLVDRSEGVGYGQREVLMNLVMQGAGAVSAEYNDLVHAITPLSKHTGPAELQIDRFTDLVLDAQFDDGSAGQLFEYELIYYPLTTDDGTAQGQKLPQPDAVVGTSITDLGSGKEAWRWNFLLQNNERADDYGRFMDVGVLFDSGAFPAGADAVLDVDQWLRSFAFATLSGAVDNYGADGSQHNARFYVRPQDQRVLYFPHDLDFFGSSSMALVGNSDLQQLLGEPEYLRAYYGHLQDIVARAYNAEYLAPWCAQLADLLPAQDFDKNCQFVADRADWVMYGASDAVTTRFPPVSFEITSGGGEDFGVNASEVELEGTGWIDVHEIALDGAPLAATWDGQGWRVTAPLVEGRNVLDLVATDQHGDVVGADSVVVTRSP